MFTNEFNQTIQADWVLISVTKESFLEASKVILTNMAGAEVNLTFDDHLEINGVSLDESLGIMLDDNTDDILLTLEKHGLNIDTPTETAAQVIDLMFGGTPRFDSYKDDYNSILIRMDFKAYISRVHGL